MYKYVCVYKNFVYIYIKFCVYTYKNFLSGTGLLYFVALIFVSLDYVPFQNEQRLLASYNFKEINSIPL